eukprot:6489134-Amphidinium_carterae.2
MDVDGEPDVRQEDGARIARGIDDLAMLQWHDSITCPIQTHEHQAQADLTVSREVYPPHTRLPPFSGSTKKRYLTEVRSLNAQLRHSEAEHTVARRLIEQRDTLLNEAEQAVQRHQLHITSQARQSAEHECSMARNAPLES